MGGRQLLGEDRLDVVLLRDPLDAVLWLGGGAVEGELRHAAVGLERLGEVARARDLARVELLRVARRAMHVAPRARGADGGERRRIVEVLPSGGKGAATVRVNRVVATFAQAWRWRRSGTAATSSKPLSRSGASVGFEGSRVRMRSCSGSYPTSRSPRMARMPVPPLAPTTRSFLPLVGAPRASAMPLSGARESMAVDSRIVDGCACTAKTALGAKIGDRTACIHPVAWLS